MSTMWMAILITMIYLISIWYKARCIFGLKAKEDSEKTPNLLRFSTKEELKQQKNGINLKKEDNGTENTQRSLGLVKLLLQKLVKYVVNSMKQDIKVVPNIAIKTAKLKHFEQGESWNEEVFDLTVEGEHEYFANGVLVHNCMDAVRYGVYTKYSKKKLKIW